MSQFCYWQVFKDEDFFLMIVIGFCALLILLYTLRQTLKIIRFFKRIDKKFILIYLFCLLWALLYVTKTTYLIVKYLNQLKDAGPGYSMFEISQSFCVIDTLPTFFLMYLLILIPYFWLRNITSFLERMRRDQRRDKYIIKFFTFYIYLRIFLFGGIGISEISFSEETLVDTLCDSLIMIILCEVFLSLLLLCYGMVKMLRNFSSLNVHDRKQKRKFIKEYLIMILCCFIRFAMDFYFIIYEKTQMEEKNCLQFRKNDFVYTTLYIILGEILMHLAPIVMILSIYRVDFEAALEESFVRKNKNQSSETMSH